MKVDSHLLSTMSQDLSSVHQIIKHSKGLSDRAMNIVHYYYTSIIIKMSQLGPRKVYLRSNNYSEDERIK